MDFEVENEVIDFKTASMADNEIFKKYFHGMLNNGIYLPPSQFESYFFDIIRGIKNNWFIKT